MACRQISSKPLAQPRLTYCYLDPQKEIFVKFEHKYISSLNFYARKFENVICLDLNVISLASIFLRP